MTLDTHTVTHQSVTYTVGDTVEYDGPTLSRCGAKGVITRLFTYSRAAQIDWEDENPSSEWLEFIKLVPVTQTKEDTVSTVSDTPKPMAERIADFRKQANGSQPHVARKISDLYDEEIEALLVAADAPRHLWPTDESILAYFDARGLTKGHEIAAFGPGIKAALLADPIVQAAVKLAHDPTSSNMKALNVAVRDAGL